MSRAGLDLGQERLIPDIDPGESRAFPADQAAMYFLSDMMGSSEGLRSLLVSGPPTAQ